MYVALSPAVSLLHANLGARNLVATRKAALEKEIGFDRRPIWAERALGSDLSTAAFPRIRQSGCRKPGSDAPMKPAPKVEPRWPLDCTNRYLNPTGDNPPPFALPKAADPNFRSVATRPPAAGPLPRGPRDATYWSHRTFSITMTPTISPNRCARERAPPR